ncbi:ABC transporter permease subunit [Salipiger abyssi]|uniref:ABC transporter permease subunit n=1 Tax=Salipiger abyssi TaxID=1250539 RepID=UPI001F3D2C16|nr:ABC transporter permease subunit [Salipiger abyssi]
MHSGHRQRASAQLAKRLPASLEHTLFALVVSCAVAIPLGVPAATRPGSWIDHLCRLLVAAGTSLPSFFTGIVLVYVFYDLLGIASSPLGRVAFIYRDPRHQFKMPTGAGRRRGPSGDRRG